MFLSIRDATTVCRYHFTRGGVRFVAKSKIQNPNPMKIPTLAERPLSVAAAIAMMFASATVGYAGLQIPYTPDAATLHLWHLDDPDGLTATDAVAANPITLTNLGFPTPGTWPYTNTSLGNPSFTGLGACMSGTTVKHLLFGGTFPDVSQFCNPESGAFTFEAVVKFNNNPLAAMDAEIIAGDNGGGLTTRGWQWRILNGQMEWNLLAGSGTDDYKANLPATGPNAAIAGAWYHVAVTFNGNNPTNGDPANILTFYWTALDANRTAADKLGQFTMPRPLDGSPSGTSMPNLGIGGSGRGTTAAGAGPGNNEGIIGSLDEARISNVARTSNQMAFVSGGASNPPEFTLQPPTNTLVGYGQTLTVPALVSGTPTLYFQWQQDGTNVAGQTGLTLVIPKATFAQAGNYQLVATNAYGSKTSMVAQVTVGAVATGLFNTGLDTNGVVSSGGIADPHWTLFRSADVAYLGPDTPIFEYSFPIQFADPNGTFSPTNGVSMWMGAGGNVGGAPVTSPIGQYVYRARFLLDSADPTTVSMGGNLWVNGSISDILVNGKSTGITLAPGGTLYVITFSLTNGFVPGWNTVDFVENLTAAGISALRVEIKSAGLALPPGLPVITSEPVNQTVRDGNVPPNNSQAEFSVTALGRSPLSYQWRADGTPIGGATNRTLTFLNPTSGGPGTNFSVVVSNDSGSVTSQVAVLRIVSTNQAPVPAAISPVVFQGQPLTLYLSDLVQSASDPDHDAVVFISADSSSTNGLALGLNNVQPVGATLVYTASDAFVGADRFSYLIGDQIDSSVGVVEILNLLSPTNQVVAPGGTASFNVGLASVPPGFSFQWHLNGTNISDATGIQLTVTNAQVANAGSYRLVVTGASGQAWPSPIAGLTVGTLGTGTGLTGDYYSLANGTNNFTGLPGLTRLDSTVDFNWGTEAPEPSILADLFMVRWHGQVQPLYTDLYTFSTTTDDGARLWVNGQLVVNRWQNQAATTASGSIPLAAGQKYDLLMEYYDNTSFASARLSWSSLHQAQGVIPMSQLYPSAGLVRPALTAALSNRTNLVLNWPGSFALQSSPDVTGPWTTLTTSIVSPYSIPVAATGKMFFRLVDPISP